MVVFRPTALVWGPPAHKVRVVGRVVVLASGTGTNLAAIIEACADGRLAAEVVAVVSDRPDAPALDRARDAGIDAIGLALRDGERRGDYDTRLADVVSEYRPDVVVLAGWMRILTMSFLMRFADQVINLHPALPGELPGVRAIDRAWEEYIDSERDHTGVMVHLVPDEGVDDGPVLGTEVVPIPDGESYEVYVARMHAAEHRVLVAALVEWFASR